MSGLSDNLYLYDLSIPGTHDSCTGTIDLSTIPNKMAQCQNTSIAIQLEHGIRYFDIRVDEDQNIKHGSIDCDVDFGDVMNDFKSYLQRYPKEVILMELSNVDDFDFFINKLCEKKKFFNEKNIYDMHRCFLYLYNFLDDNKDMGIDFN